MWKIALTAIVLFAVVSCSKKEDTPDPFNPYDNFALLPPPDTTTPVVLDSGSFQFLYHNVFNKTCANSGCHDGNFSPDFRTIYSSYNTLVKHPVIQNDAQHTFTYRVEPFNLEKSLIYTRLTTFMPNTSGMMPLAVEPGSDWPEKKDLYIQMIADWIKSGAPDTYGNIPKDENLRPQTIGIMVFNSGTVANPLPRLNGSTGPIIIPKAPVDVWFAFSDDHTDPANFKMTVVKSSRELYDFSSAESHALSGTSTLNGEDFWKNPVQFTHKATLSFPGDTSNTFIFLRTYTQDDEQTDITETPNSGTNNLIRSYFTLKVDSL